MTSEREALLFCRTLLANGQAGAFERQCMIAEIDAALAQTDVDGETYLYRNMMDAASGIETEGQDAAERLGAEHESPTAESGDAQ